MSASREVLSGVSTNSGDERRRLYVSGWRLRTRKNHMTKTRCTTSSAGELVCARAPEDRAVSAGAVIFVAAEVEHRFYDITEELVVLVFFAPAES